MPTPLKTQNGKVKRKKKTGNRRQGRPASSQRPPTSRLTTFYPLDAGAGPEVFAAVAWQWLRPMRTPRTF
jgi:hypothetical protein